jgi:hypothetical protein
VLLFVVCIEQLFSRERGRGREGGGGGGGRRRSHADHPYKREHAHTAKKPPTKTKNPKQVVQDAICPERRVGLDDALSAIAGVTHVYVSNDLQVVKVRAGGIFFHHVPSSGGP